MEKIAQSAPLLLMTFVLPVLHIILFSVRMIEVTLCSTDVLCWL